MTLHEIQKYEKKIWYAACSYEATAQKCLDIDDLMQAARLKLFSLKSKNKSTIRYMIRYAMIQAIRDAQPRPKQFAGKKIYYEKEQEYQDIHSCKPTFFTSEIELKEILEKIEFSIRQKKIIEMLLEGHNSCKIAKNVGISAPTFFREKKIIRKLIKKMI